MSTITELEPRDKLTCTAALDQAYQLALEKLSADTHGRLAKALALVQAGQVFETDHGHWEVASQSEGGYPHSVNGACDCDWAHFHPGSRCTHMLAVLLQRKTLQLLAQAQAPAVEDLDADNAGDLVDVMPTTQPTASQPQAAPLPEAPASANVRLLIEGRDVQLTLRDSDEARLLERLAAVLQQYPAPAQQAREPKGQQLSPQQHNAAAMHKRVTDFCPVHNVQMKLNQKEGRSWYSHYAEDEGRWCKGR